MISFKVSIHKRSTHMVNVVVHGSLSSMRRLLKKHGHITWKTTVACCWQSNRIPKDGIFAEIHFCPEHLTLENIAHESSHAALHRAVLIGLAFTDDDFQEYVATDTGVLTDAILAGLDSRKIPVRLGVVPRRRIFTTGRK